MTLILTQIGTSVDLDLTSSDIHIPSPSQPGLWAYSHDPENDLMKRYVVEIRTPSGWLGVKSFDDTDNMATWLWAEQTTPSPIMEFSTYRIYDQKLGKVL